MNRTKYTTIALISVLVGLFVTNTTLAQNNLNGNNIVFNGDFSLGDSAWVFEGGADINVIDGELAFVGIPGTGNTYDVQAYQFFTSGTDGINNKDSIYVGPYQVSFDARSSAETHDLHLFIGEVGGGWARYLDPESTGLFTVDQEMKTYTVNFGVDQVWETMRIGFEVNYGAGDLYIDNVIFTRVDDIKPDAPQIALSSDDGIIKIDVIDNSSAAYDVYFSTVPFSDPRDGSLLTTLNTETGLSTTHTIKAPRHSMVNYTAYVGVVAKSAKGSVSEMSSASINTITTINENYIYQLSVDAVNTVSDALSEGTVPSGEALAAFFPSDYKPFTITSDAKVVNGDKPTDDTDLSGKFWVGYETITGADYLMIYAEIMDDVLVQGEWDETNGVPNAGGAWNFDSWEAGFSTYSITDPVAGSPNHQMGAGTSDYQSRVGVTNNADNSGYAPYVQAYNIGAIDGLVPNSSTIAEVTDGMYRTLTLLSVFELSNLEPSNAHIDFPGADEVSAIPFQLSINDADEPDCGGCRETQTVWSNRVSNGNFWQTPSQWEIVGLVGSNVKYDNSNPNLFFSEYIEGGGNNKAFEIFNPNSEPIDLGNFIVLGNYNGNPYNDTLRFAKGTVIPSLETYVVAHSGADGSITSAADTLIVSTFDGGTSYATVFNGDDARALVHINGTDSMVVDLIGDPSQDPGAGWVVAGVADATKDHTLVRRDYIDRGNPNPLGSFRGDEWIVYEKDDLSHLGYHQYDIDRSKYTQITEQNIVFNGDFSIGLNYWETFDGGLGIVSIEDSTLKFEVETAGNEWDLQTFQTLTTEQIDRLAQGGDWELSFDAMSPDGAKSIHVFLGENGGGWDRYWTSEGGNGSGDVQIDGEWKTYTLRANIDRTWGDMKLGFEVARDDADLLIDNVVLRPLRENLIVNGDFSLGDSAWVFEGEQSEIAITNGELVFTNITGAGNPWEAQAHQFFDPNLLEIGADYKVSFDARTDEGTHQMHVFLGEVGGGWARYFPEEPGSEGVVMIDDQMRTYDLYATIDQVWQVMRLGFEVNFDQGDVYIDNVSIVQVGEKPGMDYIADVYMDTMMHYGPEIMLTVHANDILASDRIESYNLTLPYEPGLTYLDRGIAETHSEDGFLSINDTGDALKIGFASNGYLSGSKPLIHLFFNAETARDYHFHVAELLFNNVHNQKNEGGLIGVVRRVGDVDNDDQILAFDAARVLKYSVGLDPMPEEDPLPWDFWRLGTADVNFDEMILASDASEILQYSVGLRDEFVPFKGKQAIPEVVMYATDKELRFEALSQGLFAMNIEFTKTPDMVFAEPATLKGVLMASNVNDTTFKLAVASSEDLTGNFLTIPINSIVGDEVITVDYFMNNVKGQRNVDMSSWLTANEGLLNTPKEFELNQNYPNPFNPSTNIQYALPVDAQVSLVIYNALGQKVMELVNGQKSAGYHTATFNASALSSGVYLYRLTTPSFTQTKKMLLIK